MLAFKKFRDSSSKIVQRAAVIAMIIAILPLKGKNLCYDGLAMSQPSLDVPSPFSARRWGAAYMEPPLYRYVEKAQLSGAFVFTMRFDPPALAADRTIAMRAFGASELKAG